MTEKKEKGIAQATKTASKIIIGIALLVFGAWLLWLWRVDFWTLVKGCLGPVIILAGVIFLAIAKE
jgi:hypothetical protein